MRTVPLTSSLLLITCFLFGACGGGSASPIERGTAGPSRPFQMGFSTLPRELNGEAYTATFDLAAQHGEAVLIQRTPPWSEFVPGGAISAATAQTTADEKRAIADRKLRVFFAIDPTDGATGRDRLASLPNALAGRDFSDADVRSSFLAYAQYVALNYHPQYMALGVEMNLYYEKNREDFANFRSLYEAAREVVRDASPETQVTVTFQYEDLQGKLPNEEPHYADWGLLREFDDLVDVVAISTYPSLAYPRASDIPERYYSQLQGFTDRPIVIAEMGYSSAGGPGGTGSEAEQAAFVARGLRDAESMRMPLVIWFAAWDPSYARDTAYGVFQSIGLLRDDNSEKPAWAIWSDAALRPYQPG